jgi:hypothetical protein
MSPSRISACLFSLLKLSSASVKRSECSERDLRVLITVTSNVVKNDSRSDERTCFQRPMVICGRIGAKVSICNAKKHCGGAGKWSL